MGEYNLKFGDLEEGKKYKTADIDTVYTKKNGGLFKINYGDYSKHEMRVIMEWRFKEIEQPNEDTLKLLSLYKYPWIFKSEIGSVHISKTKPKRVDCGWVLSSKFKVISTVGLKDNINFEWLSREDDEPTHIPTLLKECGFNE